MKQVKPTWSVPKGVTYRIQAMGTGGKELKLSRGSGPLSFDPRKLFPDITPHDRIVIGDEK